MKLNEEVTTPDGKGIIVDIEVFRTSKRYGVKHHTRPIKYSPKTCEDNIFYYFVSEVQPIKSS